MSGIDGGYEEGGVGIVVVDVAATARIVRWRYYEVRFVVYLRFLLQCGTDLKFKLDVQLDADRSIV